MDPHNVVSIISNPPHAIPSDVSNPTYNINAMLSLAIYPLLYYYSTFSLRSLLYLYPVAGPVVVEG